VCNGAGLLREVQSKEGNEGRKTSDYEEWKEGNEGQMPNMCNRHVLHPWEIIGIIFLE